MERLSDLRYCSAQSLTFSTFTADEIKKLSAVKIITPLSFNSLGHPLPGGLYDPALGPVDYGGQCSTCKLKMLQCPGHMGHIELPLPVINPVYHKIIKNILKISCIQCYKVLIPSSVKYLLVCQLKLLEKGYFVEASEMETKFSSIMSGWDKMKNDIAEEILASTEMEQYVEEVLSKSLETDQEVKGEGDLRNSFIKRCVSYLYKGKRCPFCNQIWNYINIVNNKILINLGKIQVAEKFTTPRKSNADVSMGGYSFVTAKECKDYLMKIWANDADIMKAIVPMLKHTTEIDPVNVFFIKNVFVTPSNSRPVNIVNGIITEHPQNMIYKAILNDCLIIKSIIVVMNNDENKDTLSTERIEIIERIRGKDYTEKLQFAWQELQSNVDSLLDIDMKKVRRQTGIGLKQIIEKKQGILRMNMMGKRVNYAARTVITPDPNLNIDEIGVPDAFAKKLTYPVPVTVWNVTELRKLVMNGPDVHPGANFIEDENRRILKIDAADAVTREGLAKRLLTPGEKAGCKIVHRHLINGDILLLNRQPTLHRPSIMAHKARVLKGEKTFRFHYANCKSYNADFDGDEMNAHFPQNEVARSEGYNIVSVSKQYLVPKDGTPLSGLIQDHMVSGVRLSVKGKMFTKSEYMQLVFQGLSFKQGNLKTLKPCIMKPVQLWSGKQIISTLIINIIPEGQVLINLTSKAKISCKAWNRGSSDKWKAGGTPFKDEKIMTEEEVVIRQGELLCGVLDKTHYGATPYSLVHCMYELYGGEVSSALLSSFAKLFTAFLQMEGFTLGVEDILVLKHSDKKRTKLIESARKIGDAVVSKVIEVPTGSTLKKELAQRHAKDPTFRALLDHNYKTALDTYTNEINKICVPNGLLRPFPNNNLQLMVQSGAKGSTVNTMQISCLLGQIELEGKRPPLMVSGKSLPCFSSYDTSPRAGGFVDGRFMTGIKPQEFFFHCMAGREGLIDTAVKTSRSGYLQRCLVKHLEGLNVHYDMTVRDSDGSVVQFLYGEDGMEVTKCKFLNEEQLPFLLNNFYAVRNEDVLKVFKETTDIKTIRSYNKQVKKWMEVKDIKPRRLSPFLSFCISMNDQLESSSSINPSKGRTHRNLKLCKLWNKLSHEEKLKYGENCLKTPDPVVSKFQPDRHYGSITEKLDLLINNYMRQHQGEVKEKQLRSLICEKALLSLCPPGEPVGLLAAQSVGEPSTQMTLNTFHFAGRGEMNVTLGIPRLREILMVASRNIKTPSMVIPFKDVPKLESQINKLRRKLTKITLADVLESISVHEKLQLSPNRQQVYILKMKFLPHEAYKDNTIVTPKQILKYVEKKFLKNLLNSIKAKRKKVKEIITSEAEDGNTKSSKEDDEEEIEPDAGKKTKKAKVVTGDDYESSEEEPEGDDDDATTARRRARQQEEQQYSDIEDDASVEGEMAAEEAEEEWEVEERIEDNDEEKSSDNTEKEVIGRKSLVTSLDCISEYKYDTVKEQWCEVTIGLPMKIGRIDMSSKLREICSSSIVHEVSGIKRAIVEAGRNGGISLLRTDGLNMSEMYSYDKLLDLNRLFTNDIHAMALTYGIEAATRVIVKEVQDVFKVYGITVDPRHLNLIADYMTFSGVYQPLSRKGLEGGASPLQQMSFESSLGFLKSAVQREKRDDLSSPSSRLMMGAPVKSGTGSFRLLQRITV